MLVEKSPEKLSRCLGDDEDAHEEDHDEEDPHEESIHHLGDLLPLCHFDTRCSLLTEAVGDVLDVLHHLKRRRRRQRSKKGGGKISTRCDVSPVYVGGRGSSRGMLGLDTSLSGRSSAP